MLKLKNLWSYLLKHIIISGIIIIALAVGGYFACAPPIGSPKLEGMSKVYCQRQLRCDTQYVDYFIRESMNST